MKTNKIQKESKKKRTNQVYEHKVILNDKYTNEKKNIIKKGYIKVNLLSINRQL